MAQRLAEERILDILFPDDLKTGSKRSKEAQERHERTRNRLRKKLRNGDYEDHEIEVDITEDSTPMMQVFGPMGMEDIGMNLKDMMSNILPQSKKKRHMKVVDAREQLIDSEAHKLVDQDEVIRLAKERVENNGIVFLDEIDKIIGNDGSTGPDVSREGVQRDLLPIVEGSTVPTRYGMVQSDHVLFIAAGAFHTAAPADMIPELQGRFPIRVEMDKLTQKDFVKILTHPRSALIKQYMALLGAENVTMTFQKPAINAIAKYATDVNAKMENIGARRLHTIMTTLLDDILFEQPTGKDTKITITKAMVDEQLEGIAEDQDLSRYIL